MPNIEEYTPAEKHSEILNRPEYAARVRGQAGFLSVALSLGVPVLTTATNVKFTGEVANLGAGVSFSVATSPLEFNTNSGYGFANRPSNSWFNHDADALPVDVQKYAIKRIVTAPRATDAQQLAYMVNEMRILANDSLRRSNNVVKLLFVSWHEMPSHGRFWPQLILEKADHGTLSDFMASEQLDFKEKAVVMLDIASGLNYLHEHGVVHGDVKPSNILVFESTHDLCRVEAKLSDFGASIILSDYPNDKPFKARLGTLRWMSPEMEHALPIPLDKLFSSDIYSFGLVIAYISMDGTTAFESLSDDELTRQKLKDDTGALAVQAIKDSLALKSAFQQHVVSLLLLQMLSPNREARPDLDYIFAFLKIAGLMQVLSVDRVEPSPKKGLNESSPNAEASPPAIATHTEAVSQSEYGGHYLMDKVSGTFDTALRSFSHSVQASVHNQIANFKSAFSMPKNSKGLDQLTYRLVETTPFRRISGEVAKSTSLFDTDIPSCPDFAHPQLYRPSSLPRVATLEIMNDLRLRADSADAPHPESAFQLAAIYFNGSLEGRDVDLAFVYLAKAVRLGHSLALQHALNLYAANNTTIPPDIAASCLSHIEKHGSDMVKYALPMGLLRNQSPLLVDHTALLQQDLAKRYPHALNRILLEHTERYGVRVACRTTMTLTGSWQSQDASSSWDPERLSSFRFKKSDPAVSDYNAFISDLQASRSKDQPTTLGLTLLQWAVLTNDLGLMECLVRDVKADVNQIGATPGWAPLFLACLMGSIRSVRLLVEYGAAVDVRDWTGLTVLHLVSQFVDIDSIRYLVQLALEAGLSIEVKAQNGATPLYSLFTAFDYSQGGALTVLLESGADPANPVPDVSYMVTPIGLMAQKMDYKRLRALIQAAERLKSGRRLAAAKLQAFHWLLSMTPFMFESMVGSLTRQHIYLITSLLVDQTVYDEMRRTKHIFGSDPDFFSSASISTNFYMLEALLKLEFSAQLWNRLPRKTELMRACIERRSRECSMLLLDRGADLLDQEIRNQTALHHAAIMFPGFLNDLIIELQSFSSARRDERSVKQILESRDTDAYDVFGLLVRECYGRELDLAEDLRNRFNLDFDSFAPYLSKSNMSLTGALIHGAIWTGMIPWENAKYLLGITSPRPPQYTCSDRGHTLLSIAVTGPRGYSMNRQHGGHQLTKLILQKYPGVSNLKHSEDEHSALTHAVLWTNRIALQHTKAHLKSLKPPQEMPYYHTESSGATVLDAAAANLNNLNQEHAKFVPKEGLHDARVRCYRWLREDGACHHFELRGVMLLTRSIWLLSLSIEAASEFALRVTDELGLASPIINPKTRNIDPRNKDSDFGDQPDMHDPRFLSAVSRMCQVELVWASNAFRIHVGKIEYKTMYAAAAMKESLEDRMQESIGIMVQMGCNPDSTPWERLEYKQHIDGVPDGVSWSRTGKIWAKPEIETLRQGFIRRWAEQFAEKEKFWAEHFGHMACPAHYVKDGQEKTMVIGFPGSPADA